MTEENMSEMHNLGEWCYRSKTSRKRAQTLQSTCAK